LLFVVYRRRVSFDDSTPTAGGLRVFYRRSASLIIKFVNFSFILPYKNIDLNFKRIRQIRFATPCRSWRPKEDRRIKLVY
jgi:hypothetical protein